MCSLLVETFISGWALSLVLFVGMRNIWEVAVFGFVYVFFRWNKKENRVPISNSRIKLRRLFAAVFSIMVLLGGFESYVSRYSNKAFRIIICILIAGGMFIFFENTLLFIESELIYKKRISGIFEKNSDSDNKREKKLFFIYFAVILLAYIPYFLYEYPGILSPDGINQFYQVVGISRWSNHHPIAHTLCIAFFTKIGSFFSDDINVAFSFYTAFQMIFLSLSEAFLCVTLIRLGVKKKLCHVITFLYAFIPFNGVFSVYITKDTMFSAITMMLLSVLARIIIEEKNNKNSKKLWIFFTFLCILFSLFRSNGYYAYIIFVPFLIYRFRSRKVVFLSVLAALFISTFTKVFIMDKMNVIQPDFVESCCVPLQQIGRTITNGHELDNRDRELLEKIMNIDGVPVMYRKDLADGMKELVRAGNEDYLINHKKDYFELWLRLGIKYPGSYLQAFVDLTKGIWFYDQDYEVGTIEGVIANEAGLYRKPLISGKVVVKTHELMLKFGDFIPLYSLLFSMCTYTWGVLVLLYLMLSNREFRGNIIVILLPFMIIATLLIATPISTEFRYMLPIVMTTPVFVITFLETRKVA